MNWVKSLLSRPHTHDDDRRRGIFDVFGTPQGDVIYSYVYPGVIMAWHRHKKQTDYLFVVRGSLKVGLYDAKKKRLAFVYLHEQERQILKIPAGMWHGYKNIGSGEAIVSYFITPKYNHDNPDEERARMGAFGDDWETETK